MFVSNVYGDYFPNSKWKPFVWAGSLLAATTVGYLRFESGAHFPSDVLAGTVVGSAIGYVIPLLHRVENEQVSIAPTSGAQGMAVVVRLRL